MNNEHRPIFELELRVRPSIFVRTVRRSHSTEYTIFQLARKSRREPEQSLFNDNGNNAWEEKNVK